MTQNLVYVFIWYSNRLAEVQVGHSATAVFVSFLLARWMDESEVVNIFLNQFEYHIKTNTGLFVVAVLEPCLCPQPINLNNSPFSGHLQGSTIRWALG